VLAVVPSLTHFDAACSDVLWLGQRLMVDNEIAQNGLQQGSYPLSNQKRHFSINIDATVLAVVSSLSHFDAACSDVLWFGQRLMIDNEIAQNGLQQGSFHLLKLKTPLLHQYQ
jgi:hypothetical protein